MQHKAPKCFAFVLVRLSANHTYLPALRYFGQHSRRTHVLHYLHCTYDQIKQACPTVELTPTFTVFD